jgi:hypothetical protein
MTQRVYTSQGHRFFDNLVTFVASIASLGTAFEIQSNLVSRPYGPNDYLTLVGFPGAADCEFRIYPEGILSELLANRWPSQVVIDEVPINHAPPAHPIWLTGMQGVHGSMIANAFVQYFEATRVLAEQKYTTNTQAWPLTWNFGRVVRNALSHGGTVNFTNQNAPLVSWRSLSYGPAQNGRQLLYQDITSVELILLMEEMDALL